MEDTLLEFSRAHFAKAEGTPFTTEPLGRLLQYDGLTPYGNKISRGRPQIEHHHLDEPTRAILTHLKQKVLPGRDITHTLDYDGLMEGIKKWPERTTTSPSGRHLGIYKTLRKHVMEKKKRKPGEPEPPPPARIHQGRDILFLIFDIMSIAIHHTYPLQRWRTVWTIFIEKELGNPDIDRLRCIMIFEADWQLLLKWHSSYGFLPRTESAGTLTYAQGGGRKGRSAIDQAVQHIVENEIIHLRQQPSLDLYLDLRTCFDLMVEACHNLACRRHGADIAYLRLHAKTHQAMKYHVRYKFGVSRDYNTFAQHPWHGAGQGAADAALHYIVLSDTIIDAYHSKIAPSCLQDPTKAIIILRSLKAFIDDVVLHASEGPYATFETLRDRAAIQIQWWEQLVQVTGGSLNPKKCCAIMYSWNPDKSGILRLCKSLPDAASIPTSPDNSRTPIRLARMDEGIRYLGVYITGDRSSKPMEDHLWEKALRYTLAFQKTPMNHREAGVLYRSCFLPALTYPLPACWLPDRFFNRIHCLSTSTVLNKMGFHKNLPRCMVFAPRARGGVGMQHLQHEMETQQIMILLRHLRAKTPLGNAFTILIRTYQLWAGISGPVLTDTRPCEWVPDCWLSRVRRTLHAHNIQLLDDYWTVPSIRQFDVHIMDAISELQLTPLQLTQFNACRMYLQVTTLAEIVDHTGGQVLPQTILQKNEDNPIGLHMISHSLLEWPTTHLPSKQCWRLWTRTIGLLFAGDENGTRLCHPLGPWKTNFQVARYWKWRISPMGSLLNKPTEESPTRAAIMITSNRRYATFSLTIPTNQSFNGSPVTPSDQHNRRIQFPIMHPDQPTPPDTPMQFFQSLTQQFRSTLPTWQKPLFGPITRLQPTNRLYQLSLQAQPIAIVSDASLQKDHRSGFAWVIINNATPLWRGIGLAPGDAEDMHSGRAEAFGVLAAILFLSHYVQSFGHHLFPAATINGYCDNNGVVTTIMDILNSTITRPNDTTNDDRDVYLAIHQAILDCQPITLKFFHVKGHQDSKSKKPLTTIEQCNVDCDHRAKQFVRTSTQASTSFHNPEIPAARPHLRIAGKLICRQFIPTLRHTMSMPAYHRYLRQKFNWMPNVLDTIHWVVLQRSMDKFNNNDQRRLVLFINDKLPLRASKAHPHIGSPLCPSCQREEERPEHFLICKHPEWRNLFATLKDNLTTTTRKLRLHPCIFTALWLGLNSVRQDAPYPDIAHDLLPRLRSTIQQQSSLGWNQLYQGRITRDWAQAIDVIHPELALSGEQVMTQLLCTIWTYILEVWKIRNTHLHRNAAQLDLPNYRQAVINLYEQRHLIPAMAQDALYRQPLEVILEQPPPRLQTYAQKGLTYFNQQLKAAKIQARLNTPDIRSFFGPKTQHHNDLQPP